MIIKTKTKILIAKIISRTLLPIMWRKDPIIDVTRRKIRYKLDLREGIDLAIYLGVYENSTVRAYNKLIKKDDYIIDVGANIGAHTLQFADLVGDGGRVIAFEPTDYAFTKLQVNILLNPQLANRITANQIMLIDSNYTKDVSVKELYSSWPLTPSGTVHPDHLGKKMTITNATASTLDAYIFGHDVPKVDILKIDVDGYECIVLNGAKATIEKFSPVIIMELCPYLLEETGHDISEIIEYFKDVNFQIRDIRTNKRLPLDHRMLQTIIPKGSGINIIACKS